MSRFLLFALTGVLYFVYWVMARPSFEMTASMTEWLHVLWFSATLLSLAVALPVLGRMVGGRRVVRLASIAGAGVGLSSVANIFEDGFRIDAFFFAFILGTLILDVALLALATVIARTFPGRSRLFAVIPAGTVAGILLFVVAGGPIMLVTWLAAAAAAVPTSGRAPMRARPTTPSTGRFRSEFVDVLTVGADIGLVTAGTQDRRPRTAEWQSGDGPDCLGSAPYGQPACGTATRAARI